MHIRPLQPTDFPAAASISAEAFWDDEQFSWRCPGKAQFPEHFRQSILRLWKTRARTPGCVVIIAETDERDPDWQGEPEVIGGAIWQRHGQSAAAKGWQRESFGNKLERGLLQIEDLYVRWAGLDRVTDAARTAQWRRECAPNFAGVREHWKLAFLVVARREGRRGVGGRLVDWGLNLAAREGVPATLETSRAAEGLYRSRGFREISRKPVADFWCVAMVWEPAARRVKEKESKEDHDPV
ncbi:MAG: hypothetical protein M1826_007742 [Phylliscum demangeonii]|nr:MAG: hypothetical protein M1826_007742 [Phylliscum demangeonii]